MVPVLLNWCPWRGQYLVLVLLSVDRPMSHSSCFSLFIHRSPLSLFLISGHAQTYALGPLPTADSVENYIVTRYAKRFSGQYRWVSRFRCRYFVLRRKQTIMSLLQPDFRIDCCATWRKLHPRIYFIFYLRWWKGTICDRAFYVLYSTYIVHRFRERLCTWIEVYPPQQQKPHN